MSRYHDYLCSAAWQRKRQSALELAGYRCQDCGVDRELEVHHLTYDRLGNEVLSDLRVLCRPCHGERHGYDRPEVGMEPIQSILHRVLARLDATAAEPVS